MIDRCIVNPDHPSPASLLERDGYPVYRCPQCETIMADSPYVTDQYDAAAYYTMEFSTVAGIERNWGLRWNFVLDRLAEYGDPSPLLDVGAGNGFFVHLARQRGLDASGIEISETEIRFAREKLGVELRSAQLSALRNEAFSTLCLFSVIEHVPDPHEILSESARQLASRGLLALTTPNPRCLRARVKGLQRWEMIAPPHHLNLFSSRSLISLLDRHGFKPVYYTTLSTYMQWLRRFDTPGDLLRRGMFHLLRAAALGADHFVIARKRG